jgi:hypothetical protein
LLPADGGPSPSRCGSRSRFSFGSSAEPAVPARLRRDSRAGQARGSRRGGRRPHAGRRQPGLQCGCTPSDTGRAAGELASHEVPRKGRASRDVLWRCRSPPGPIVSSPPVLRQARFGSAADTPEGASETGTAHNTCPIADQNSNTWSCSGRDWEVSAATSLNGHFSTCADRTAGPSSASRPAPPGCGCQARQAVGRGHAESPDDVSPAIRR